MYSKRVVNYLSLRVAVPFPLLMLVLVLLTTSCKKEKPEQNPESEFYSLTLSFTHFWDGDTLIFDDPSLVNHAGNPLSINTLKYLLSSFSLLNSDGLWVEIPNQYGFINPKESRNECILKNVPTGNYSAIKFSIGLPNDVNIGDPTQYDAYHPLNPFVNQMHWSWSDGYIFLSLEGVYEPTSGGTAGYSYHIAFEENLMRIELPGVDLNMNDNRSLGIDFNVHEAWKNPETFDINLRGAVSHSTSDGGIANTFRDNILDAFSLE